MPYGGSVSLVHLPIRTMNNKLREIDLLLKLSSFRTYGFSENFRTVLLIGIRGLVRFFDKCSLWIPGRLLQGEFRMERRVFKKSGRISIFKKFPRKWTMSISFKPCVSFSENFKPFPKSMKFLRHHRPALFPEHF